MSNLDILPELPIQPSARRLPVKLFHSVEEPSREASKPVLKHGGQNSKLRHIIEKEMHREVKSRPKTS